MASTVPGLGPPGLARMPGAGLLLPDLSDLAAQTVPLGPALPGAPEAPGRSRLPLSGPDGGGLGAGAATRVGARQGAFVDWHDRPVAWRRARCRRRRYRRRYRR